MGKLGTPGPNLEREARPIWKRVEGKYNLPTPVPEADKRELLEDYNEEWKDLCLAERPGLLSDITAAIEKKVGACARYASALSQSPDSSPGRKARPPRTQKGPPSPQVAFRLRHRARLFAFVASQVIPLMRQLEGNFKPPQRVHWKEVARAWSKRNPQDALSADSLKRQFNRARNDTRVAEPYVAGLQEMWGRWAEAMKPFWEGKGKECLYLGKREGRFILTGRIPHTAWESNALEAAIKRKCAFLADAYAWPRDTQFCQRECVGCKTLRQLVNTGELSIPTRVRRSAGELKALRAAQVTAFKAKEKRMRKSFIARVPKPRRKGKAGTSREKRERLTGLVSREEAMANASRVLAAFRKRG